MTLISSTDARRRRKFSCPSTEKLRVCKIYRRKNIFKEKRDIQTKSASVSVFCGQYYEVANRIPARRLLLTVENTGKHHHAKRMRLQEFVSANLMEWATQYFVCRYYCNRNVVCKFCMRG